MRQIAIAGLPAFLVLFGCTLVKPPSPAPAAPATAQSPPTAQGTGTTANSTAPPSGSAASQPASPPSVPGRPAPATRSKDSSKAAPQPATGGTGSSSSSVPSAAHQGTADSSGAVKPKPPVSKNAGNAPAAPVGAAAEPSKPTAAAPAASATTSPARQSPPPAPTLDLASLEERLKETRAIGVFSKLSLKNQVDDLLDQFRAYHKRQAKLSLSELRQRYDLLLLKVLSLLQDGDPPLAAAISTSREAIWGILTDPDKFAKI